MKNHKLEKLCRRYSDGGASPAEQNTKQAEPDTGKVAEKQAENAESKTTAEKAYSQADIDNAVRSAIAKHIQEQEATKDYSEMSPEQKVQYLEAQAKNREMKEFTVGHLNDQKVPIEFALFLQGKDENETEARTADFKAAYEKSIQNAVDKRFKENGYQPSAAANGTVLGGTAMTFGNSLEASIAEKLNLK